MMRLISIDIEKNDDMIGLCVKNMELNASIMERLVIFRVKGHDSLVAKECDSVLGDKGSIVLLPSLYEKVL
jgi:hypothetical protein